MLHLLGIECPTDYSKRLLGIRASVQMNPLAMANRGIRFSLYNAFKQYLSTITHNAGHFILKKKKPEILGSI